MKTTKTRNLLLSVVVLFALCGVALAGADSDRFYLPQSDQPFDGKVETRIGKLEFDNQYPSKDSMNTLLDAMDFHGATQAYLWGIPIASFANLQYYMNNVFKVREGELVKTTNLKQKLGILTANATTPYIIGNANLSKTGPFVIELPAGPVAGMIDDFWQRPITDLGLPGPDKGKGAKYLIVPPGYKEDKPGGYRVYESPTMNIFIGVRMLDADQKKADALQAKVKTYAYKDRANPPKNLFPEPSAKYFFGPPRGMAFWERLHEVLIRARRSFLRKRHLWESPWPSPTTLRNGRPNPIGKERTGRLPSALIQHSARRITTSLMNALNGCTKPLPPQPVWSPPHRVSVPSTSRPMLTRTAIG